MTIFWFQEHSTMHIYTVQSPHSLSYLTKCVPYAQRAIRLPFACEHSCARANSGPMTFAHWGYVCMFVSHIDCMCVTKEWEYRCKKYIYINCKLMPVSTWQYTKNVCLSLWLAVALFVALTPARIRSATKALRTAKGISTSMAQTGRRNFHNRTSMRAHSHTNTD